MHLSLISLLVRDYDEALAYFVDRLGFALIEDRPLSTAKRWVVVAPDRDAQTRILLAKAVGPVQKAAIGDQSGGRVFLFLTTEDFPKRHAEFVNRGVTFVETPREEPYGTVAVFADLYGNRWDLIGLSSPT